MTEPVVVIRDLEKSFGKQKVLDQINLNLYKKENLVIVGSSGSGKTQLIRCIIGLNTIDGGKVEVLGEDMNSIQEKKLFHLRKKIGYLFQGGALYDFLSVGDNLSFSLKRQPNRKTDKEIQEIVEKNLSRVGLQETIHKMPAQLSGGMRKRVALARSLILDPEIILYDEPTTGLDPLTSREINQLILEMREQLGISSLIVTHDMKCVEMTADRILVLNQGKIVAEGGLNELKNSDNSWVRSFFN